MSNLLSMVSAEDQASLDRAVKYSHLGSISEVWPIAAAKFADIIALEDPHGKIKTTLTYRQMSEQIAQFASGLQQIGLKGGDRLSLFADNSARWFIADQGSMMAGAVNAVRSAQADAEELLYILDNSGSTFLVIENLTTLQKLADRLPDFPLKAIILLSDEDPGDGENSPARLNFWQICDRGKHHPLQPVRRTSGDLATLIYTSGTTGKPKGAMLSHGNLLYQIATLPVIVTPEPGDRILSLLPSWHVYERTIEYYLLSQGCSQRYSNIRQFKTDLKTYKPHYMVGVPRIWESIYETIQKEFREQPPHRQKLIQAFLSLSTQYIEAKRIAEGLDLENLTPSDRERSGAKMKTWVLAPVHQFGDRLVYRQVRQATGGHIKYVISGGGSLARHIDKFFEVINFPILVGYGLTETSPVLTARRAYRNLRGSSGLPLPDTEIQIIDLNTRQPLPRGETGLIVARGPQIMQGYYQNPQATAQAIDPQGWFDTGDLGFFTPEGQLVITGRAKDTIVLTNGENIEPQPIEEACVRSPYIDQIMLVGQDQRSLGALIVPNQEALVAWAKASAIENLISETLPDGTYTLNLDHPALPDLFRQELNREVKNRPGYRPDDRIGPFRLINEPFSIDNGLMTQTLKIKRPLVSERYRDMIDGMFT